MSAEPDINTRGVGRIRDSYANPKRSRSRWGGTREESQRESAGEATLLCEEFFLISALASSSILITMGDIADSSRDFFKETWVLKNANLIISMQTWIPVNANLNLQKRKLKFHKTQTIQTWSQQSQQNAFHVRHFSPNQCGMGGEMSGSWA